MSAVEGCPLRGVPLYIHGLLFVSCSGGVQLGLLLLLIMLVCALMCVPCCLFVCLSDDDIFDDITGNEVYCVHTCTCIIQCSLYWPYVQHGCIWNAICNKTWRLCPAILNFINQAMWPATTPPQGNDAVLILRHTSALRRCLVGVVLEVNVQYKLMYIVRNLDKYLLLQIIFVLYCLSFSPYFRWWCCLLWLLAGGWQTWSLLL